VLVSSHLLAEIEQVCTHVGIMSRGRLLLQGERAALTDREGARLAVTTRSGQADAAAEVLRGLGLAEVARDGRALPGGAGTARLTAALGPTPPEKVSAALVHAGVDLVGLAVDRPSLEQVFVELTGEGFDVAR
jgi:ABC-2 type transport system ATP-binding protein